MLKKGIKLKYLNIYLGICFLIIIIIFQKYAYAKTPSVTREQLPETTLILAQIQLAKDYLNAGQSLLAISLLQKIIALYPRDSNSQTESLALFTLGNAYMQMGDYSQAIDNYLLSNSSFLSSPNLLVSELAILNNLSLAYYQQGQDLLQEADNIASFDDVIFQQKKQESEKMQIAALSTASDAIKLASSAPNSLSSVRAWLNWQKINGNSSPSDFNQQMTRISSLPPSSSKARLLIEMAEETDATTEKIRTIEAAISTAEAIKDYRTLSWAWGANGALFLSRGLFSQALLHTSLALNYAEIVFATDIMYRWQWQLGRIYTASKMPEQARLAYSQAISLIELTKKDLLIGIRRKQVNFTKDIEPIYRQYFKLLVEEFVDYEEAWHIAELLAIAELESYFGDNCFGERTSSFQTKSDVAIIRSVIFDDTTYMMLKLPSNEIKVYRVKIAAGDLNNLINQWRYQLEFPRDNAYRIKGQQLYKLFIQPLVSDLSGINHLVFVNDGNLRTVPMAALYDNGKHLIEQYSISYAISSNLENNTQHNNQLLAFGISEFPNNVAPLPAIKQEILGIKQVIGGQFFLNQDFTENNLEKELEKPYSLLHLATHSSFGGSLENIYLQAYNKKISLLELEEIFLSNKIALQLLVLSSCETAIGDEDALLGLAGIGIRTGISNTIGSVWAVNSSSTVDLFVHFYDYYTQENTTSSEALRQAQLQLINRQLHPYHWSGFINLY